ncbi:Holliday junction resolvase RuvX [Lacticaseibacillus pantheris]|jgi:putative Holliday junction resolvase|uniref:Putative pre-16S rRNA nuclease n=1 Tax=Lacticaseibacillus pantheris DSM 15945 = JCM 12539 = NBRC 106106 TaxID=1423783 RepID=A0A0R1TV17_9LACO|nr:Holliday junction resolvase RuvX [Lacticaseibacillus pantheris]KRL85037.1 Holliday junction resolvase-like protein [Lacticaseibacillus pantheris DSM 15945 = JCM 12539 = NBRC 106106]WKF85790.1 Holliday junction resolvase RuvX [Lacticaseibacillus pantheris]
MRLLGLDVGSKTVGVAVSDPLGWTAQGLEIIPIDEERGNLGMGRLKQLVAEYQPDGFVLGLPKNMNNTEGPRVTQTKAYAERLVKKFGLPVDFIDERLTTVSAYRVLIDEADVSRREQKQVIDKMAAQFILQNYLDARGKLTQQS